MSDQNEATSLGQSETEHRLDPAPRDMFAQHEGQLDGFLSAEASTAMRARQKSRAQVMGVLLGAAALLFFAITIVKTGGM